jgi:sugar phosphate isomerase/epimerase
MKFISKDQNRRNFLKNTSLASLGLLVNSNAMLSNTPLLNKIGIQLFSVPKMLTKDFDAALNMLSGIGFREIETYGPYPFSTDLAKKYWNSVTPQLGFDGSGYFGHSQAEIINIMKSHGFNVPSMHTDIDTLQKNMGTLADAANKIGAKYVVLPSIPEDHRKTLDDYKRTADDFNKIGAEALKNGIRFAYHNHGYGLKVTDGKMPLDIILDGTDPKLVFLELDLYWTTAGGASPIDLIKKHSGRYKMMHIKDMKQKVHFAGDGGEASQWIALFPYMSNAGEGILDLPSIIKTAKENGMEHFFVEQDMVAEPAIALQKSFNFLKGL